MKEGQFITCLDPNVIKIGRVVRSRLVLPKYTLVHLRLILSLIIRRGSQSSRANGKVKSVNKEAPELIL